jgi:hypothetical protein
MEHLLGCSKKKKIFSKNFCSLPMMFGSNLKGRIETGGLVDVFVGYSAESVDLVKR